jgi:hypothetical protein
MVRRLDEVIDDDDPSITPDVIADRRAKRRAFRRRGHYRTAPRKTTFVAGTHRRRNKRIRL